MPIIEGDFTGISSNIGEQLEEGLYRFKLVEIQDQSKDEDWKAANLATDKTPALIFISEVQTGDRAGGQTRDYIYTKQKDGKINKMGMGRIKGYAEAIVGKEAANSPKGIDTDTLIGGTFDGFIKVEKYTKDGEQKSNAKLAKILPAS